MIELLLSPIGRKIGGALAILALVGGLFAFAYSKGSAAGHAAGTREQLEQDKAAVKQELSQFQTDLTTARAAENDAQQRFLAAQAAAQVANQALVAIATKRQKDAGDVAKVADPDLQADIRQRVGLVPSGEKSPLTSAEFRAIDGVLADYSDLKTENDTRKQETAAMQGQLNALDARLTSVEKQRDAAITFSNQMVVHYTAAYNVAQVHHGKFIKIITFGLVHDRHFDLPAPTTLKP